MSDQTPNGEDRPQIDPDQPVTASDAAGSVLKRGQHPVTTSGAESSRGRTASAKDIPAEAMGSTAPPVPAAVRPARKIGRRRPLTDAAADAQEAFFSRPSDEDGTHAVPAEAFGIEHDPAQVDPREDKFAELQVSALFALAAIGAILFVLAFVLIDPHEDLGRWMDLALGGSFTLSLSCLGAGLLLWAKKLLPHDKAVQERHEHYSPEEEELAAEEVFFKGVREMGLGSRKMLRRTLLGAAALLPIPAVLMLRDLGPLPGNRLRETGWAKGKRLVDVETRLPIKVGQLSIGSIATVMPDGFDSVEDMALAPTILIRFGPGEIKSAKEEQWGYHDHVAYSKICSHAGCPISLYEQQSHHLLCPCHQSTFDMANDANVIFGPAARRLPQLPITVDSEGYFVALSGYEEPVGPSFWERGDANNDDVYPGSAEETG